MIDLSIFYTLGTGQTGAVLCPTCGGGQSKERSLTVHKDQFGKVKWYCFRASCGEKGQTFTGAPLNEWPDFKPSLRPYEGELLPINSCDIKWFKDTYNLDNPDIQWDGKYRFILPIRKYDGSIRGHVSRRPWDGDDLSTPKSIIYWNEEGPLLSWYTNGGLVPYRRTLLVEDQLSAMRAAQHRKIKTVAILGTCLTNSKVAELQKHTEELIIALDADATSLAFKLARKYGQAFNSCKVLVLEQDIKDMPIDKLMELGI